MDHSDCDLRFLSDGTIWDDSCDRVVEAEEIRSYKYDAIEITETAGDWRPEPPNYFSDVA